MFEARRRKRNQELAAAVAVAVVEALKPADRPRLQEAGDFFESSLKGMTGFLSQAGDLALRGAASALGQRGGRRTQQRKRERARAIAREHPACPMCVNPMRRDVTFEMIAEHRKHEHNGSAVPEERNENQEGADGRTELH
jgi:hypothetical protein